jgi:hypothetical protein
LIVGLLLRIAVSVWNAYFGPSFGGEDDAVKFHEFAVDAAAGYKDERDYVTGWMYANLLSFVYSAVMPSLFLGGLLTGITWLLSAIILIKICRVVAIGQRATLAIAACYAFLPSSFLVTAITLREAYQMLFVNLILLSGLHLMCRFRLLYAVLFAFSAYAAAWLHAALAAFGLLAVIIFITAKMLYQRMRLSALFIAAGTVATAFFGAVVVIGYDLSFSLSELVTIFRAGTPDDARANYPSTLVFSSDYELIADLPFILMRYLFEPMPWRIGGIADLYLFFENVARLVLIVTALRASWLARPIRFDLLALTACYFACEAVWAIGTVNWGTASRHHLPMLGCLLVIGFARYGRTALPRIVEAAPRNRVVSSG